MNMKNKLKKTIFSLFVIHKHTAKHMITLCVPILLMLLYFFTVYENEWKEHKF